MSIISNRIQSAMDLRGLKQVDIINATGISKGALSSYLSGKYDPKQKNIFKLATALSVDPAWLMGANVPMESNRNIIEEAHLLAAAKKSPQAMSLLKSFFAIPEDKRDILINMATALEEKER